MPTYEMPLLLRIMTKVFLTYNMFILQIKDIYIII